MPNSKSIPRLERPRSAKSTGFLMFALCSIGLLAGCSDGQQKLVPISGQVLIDGKPLGKGAVRFVPEGARMSVGRLDEEGRFVLTCYQHGDGAAVGTHRIAILASESISDDVTRWHAPKNYASHKTSGISKDITEATDDLVIELSWDGGKPFDERG